MIKWEGKGWLKGWRVYVMSPKDRMHICRNPVRTDRAGIDGERTNNPNNKHNSIKEDGQ